MAEAGMPLAPRRYRLLVFDWDGTLADSTSIIADALRQACADVGEPTPDVAVARHVIGLGMADAVRHVAPGLPIGRYPDLSMHYRNRYLARERDIPLFAGVPELLEELENAGFLLAVATGKTRRGLARSLGRHSIANRFVATRCADEGMPKPHPDMLLKLMEILGAAAGETLMIGDTTHDLELASRAGAAAVAVAYGAHPSNELARHRPLAMVHSVAELRQWLSANA
jgi:phosphoglycolate phosphatase